MSPHPPHGPASLPGDSEDDPDMGPSESRWPALFASASPRVIMARLLDGDPLELAARSAQILEERALLLPISRLRFRTLARIAYTARRYRGKPALSDFLQRRIDESLDELIEEDMLASNELDPEVDLSDPPYPRVAAILGIELPLTLAACAAFNTLPEAVRARSFPVLIQGRSISACASAGLGPPDEIVGSIRTALQAISRRIGHTVEWPRNGPKGGAEHGA